MSWRALENEMSDGLSAEFAEPIRHQPMLCAPNERPQVDPSRAVQTTKGVFEEPWKDSFISKGEDSTRAPPAAHHSTRCARLMLELRDLTSAVRQGDWFALLERGDVYEVTDLQADGHGRIVLELVLRGRHNPNFKL